MNLYYKHLKTLIVNKAATSFDSQTNNRSSHSQMFFKIGVLKNFANFTGKYPCQSLPQVCNIFKERLQHRCFPVIYAKILRTTFSQNTFIDCFWNKLIWLNLFQVMILAKQLKKWCSIFLLQLQIKYWIFLKTEVLKQWITSLQNKTWLGNGVNQNRKQRYSIIN